MTTRVNLLPWRELRQKEQAAQVLRLALFAFLLMGMVILFAYMRVSSMVDNQARRNDFLNQEIAKVDQQIKKIRDIKKQREALIARMQVIEQLQTHRTQMVHLFDDLVRDVPEGVYLTSMKQSGTSFVLNGVAQSNARVSTFMRTLDASNWFTNPDLDVINVVPAKSGDRLSEFVLRVSQADKAAQAKKGKGNGKP